MLNKIVCLLVGVILMYQQDCLSEPVYFPPVEHALNVVWGEQGSQGNPDYTVKCPQLIGFMKDLNIKLTRIGIAWRDIEKERGKFNWAPTDKLVDFLSRNGIDMIMVHACAPDWALSGELDDEKYFNEHQIGNLYSVVWPSEKFLSEFLNFTRLMLERYKDKVRYFEFWNEPDGMAGPVIFRSRDGKIAEVKFGGDATRYTYWLKQLYPVIKKHAPQAKLAAGSLSVPNTNFVKAIYAAGGKGYFDAISLHPYSNEGIDINWVKSCRQVMLSYGDYRSEIWVTEYGWDTSGKTDEFMRAYAVELEKQGERVTAAIDEFSKYPYITQVYHHTLNDWPWADENPTGINAFGLVDNKLISKPSYAAYKEAIQNLKSVQKINADFIVPSILYAGYAAPVEFKGKDKILNLSVPEGWNTKPLSKNKFEVIPKLQKYNTGDTVPIILKTGTRNTSFTAAPTYKGGDKEGVNLFTKYVEIVSPVQISLATGQSSNLNAGVETPVRFTISNVTPYIVKGKLKISVPENWQVKEKGKEVKLQEVILNSEEVNEVSFNILPPADVPSQRYKLRLSMEINGMDVTDLNFSLGINYTVKRKPVELTEFAKLVDSVPLHRIDHPTIKSYFNFFFDDEFLYFVAVIHKEKIIQTKRNADMWQEDSVQIAVDTLSNAIEGAGYDRDDYEYTFGLTPDGALVWRHTAPESSYPGLVEDIILDIGLVTGKTVYRVCIPWHELKPFNFQTMSVIPASVLVNFYDGQTRDTAAWAGGIGDGKQPYKYIGLYLEK